MIHLQVLKTSNYYVPIILKHIPIFIPTGDDGVNYASDCHLQSTSCRLEKAIWKAHNGPCNNGK